MGPYGGADLHFCSPKPDTSLHCITTDTEAVHSGVIVYAWAFASTGDRVHWSE